MSLRWTPEQLSDYLARRGQTETPELLAAGPADDGPEWQLQDQVESWCKQNGFYVFHDRSRRKNVRGTPDLIIAMPKGRTLWVELKTKTGRLAPEQRRVGELLRACGHQWATIKSFDQFLRLVYGNVSHEKSG